MTEIFSEMDARLSMVPRWTVVPTLQNQTVAEHCFNVERIARRIAEQWFHVRDTDRLDRISQIALHHDDDEAITGDIPSPAKAILSEDWIDSRSRLWYNASSPLRDIVKLADLMEMYRFLILEFAMGNRYIENYAMEIRTKTIEMFPGMKNEWLDWAHHIAKMRGTTRGATS